jgi:Phage terminase, small subunit
MLSAKQMLFAREYVVNANGRQAAITAGYSEKTADQQASRLLKNVKVQEYIDSLMNEVEKETIADAEEVLKLLTDIMRGDEGDKVTLFDSGGNPTPGKVAKTADRIKAAELLGKRYAMFTDKKEISGSVNIENKLGDILEQIKDD